MFARSSWTVAVAILLGCQLVLGAQFGCEWGGQWHCKKRGVDPNGVVSNPTSLPNCSPSDNFVISVLTSNSHLWLKFTPVSPANSACGTYIFDSEQWTDSEGKEYSVGILQAIGNVFGDQPAGGYVLGNVTGSQLLAAIHAFDAKEESQYDVITNNCASRLIDVIVFLGLESSINDAALESISQSLNGGRLIGMVRGASNLARVFPDLTRQQIMAKSDLELVSGLARWYLARELAAYRARA